MGSETVSDTERFEEIAHEAGLLLAEVSPSMMFVSEEQIFKGRNKHFCIDVLVKDDRSSIKMFRRALRPAMKSLGKHLKEWGASRVAPLPLYDGRVSMIHSAFIGGMRVREYPAPEHDAHLFRFETVVGQEGLTPTI
jgi:hypothetical protein